MDNFTSESGALELFERGWEDDFEGLQIPEFISEDIQNRPILGRELHREDVFQQAQVVDESSDSDLGDSSGCE